ncbi:aldo/keto reductase [Microvirga subterranea]|uniref:Aryl-alcohol dehydrogenase-like predicted oxidoreductase n=1 Tax=Microvirga subterranea TaxID=186651 RepID=A0A370HIK4_9HYPH|nr:aldo/keto reductase [Microvirga subterranea]RDI57993.1 aryl-alcohol dehydrogenase-like predicted oxidoreductase [Microvirga subterranea]
MTVETIELAPGYRISRMLRGGWQLAGGHGAIETERAIADMAAFVDQGVTTFDCADIYTGVEEMIGLFRERMLAERGSDAMKAFKVHTKFVPDWDALPRVDRAYVRDVIDRSLRRLRTERLDLVQFHWWNYDVPRVVETALILKDLQDEGKIHEIGGTNFDTSHTRAMLDAGVPLVSMQVQYSLLDQRPENGLVALCQERGMKLLCYGTVAGGFLSERWLGAPEPQEPYANRSLVKYKLIIDDFGGWSLFQELLATLKEIGRKHRVSLTSVATRWVLDRPAVAGAIVGARYAEHLADNLDVFRFTLDGEDRAAIEGVLARKTGPEGDTYTLERDREGRHGRIMHYNLSKA